MNKGIILYQSKYGATKKYAQWIKEATQFDCMETKKADINALQKYETILLGGGIYASGIAGLSFLKKNRSRLQGKKILVFCVGASPYDEKAYQELLNHNFSKELSDIPCFYCRGKWNEEAMSFMDKTLCRMLRKFVEKQNPDTYEPWQKALLCASQGACDWTDRKYLEPLFAELEKKK